MIDGVIKAKAELLKAENADIQTNLPTECEWSKLTCLHTTLQSFALAVKNLEGENYITSSLVFPTLLALQKKLQEEDILEPTIITEMKQSLLKLLNEQCVLSLMLTIRLVDDFVEQLARQQLSATSPSGNLR